MACSIVGIANTIASEDIVATKKLVKRISKMTDTERALATATPIGLLSDIIVNSNPTLNGEKVHVLNLSRVSEGEFSIKFKLGKSDEVLEESLTSRSPFKSDRPGLSIDKNSLETFYSDYDHSHNNDDFEALALDVTNNPEKILEVANHLIDADEYHNDKSYNTALLGQISRIQDVLVDMIPKMNVHINNKGEENTGKILIKGDNSDIYISKGIGGSKSLLEIYAHELYHSVTHFALSAVTTSTRKVTARIERVRDNFLENTTEKDLVRTSGNTLTEKQAAEVMDHLSDPEKGLHEFVALAMTNKAVVEQLVLLNTTKTSTKEKRTLLEVLIDVVASLFHSIAKRVTGEPDSDDLSRMVFLVTKLHTAHKKPLRAKKLVSIRNLISIFEPVEKKFSEYLDKKIEKSTADLDRNQLKKGESKLKYYVKLAAKSFYDDQSRNIIGNNVSLLAFRGGMFTPLAPEGSLRTILRDASQSDLTQDKAEALGMISGNIDQHRQFLAVQVSKVVLEYFANKDLTEAQEEMLTDMVIDTDLSAIYESHDIDKLLSSDLEINKSIREKEEALKALVDERVVNFYKAQSSLLAGYMVHGTDNVALLLNAENIAKMVGTPKQLEYAAKGVVDLIDEMTTLKALKMQDKKKKIEFRDLIRDEPEGVRNLVAFQNGQKQKAAKDIFPTESDRFKIIKGYSTQITDPDISVVSAPLASQKEMESQGYQLKTKLGKHALDENATPMALYINHKFMESTYHRVGMRLTEKSRRGVTVSESFLKSAEPHQTLRASLAISKLRKRRLSVISSMFDGTYDITTDLDDSLLTPSLDNLGKVSDFRYEMDKGTKIKVLGMERKISIVMGKTAAATYDKKESDSFNKQMMDLIMEDADKNKKGKTGVIGINDKEYIKIEKNSSNDDIRALWKILPDNVKKDHMGGFFVRRDLMYTYLGFKEMGMEDVLGFGLLSPNVLTTAMKQILRFAEKLWQEIVKISKIDIIIRTPGVFIGNVISNFMLMYVSGYSFVEIMELKYQGIKELNIYTEGLKESITLRAKEEAGLITAKELRRLNVIENNLQNSPVKDLVSEGFYTTIVEEIEHGGDTGSYFNRKAKKKLKNMPKIFRNGLDILYITENTKLFKMAEKGIQASDFAARYAQYHLMVEGGAKKADAIKAVRDNFIDYNKPNSKFVEFANKNGFVMFTKYFTRIQRVLKNYGMRHPLKLALSLAGQDYVMGDIDDITDQSIVTKDMGNLFHNPVDHIMRVVTPTFLEGVKALAEGASEGSSEFKA